MSKSNDTAFMTSFLGVLAGLVALTFAIIFLSTLVTHDGKGRSDFAAEKIENRIAPIGTVVTDPSALVQHASAAAHVALSADQVYATVCSACHMGGLLGAPKLGDKAAWSARKSAAGGLSGLVMHAINGKNSMPARGGKADLSDDEIKATVEWMLMKSGA